jgi:hypothetical protein
MASMMSKEVEVREGETTFVDFTSREILVTGRVTKSGTPLPAVRLRFMAEGGGMSFLMTAEFDSVAGAPTGPQRDTAVTSEDGTFALIVSAPGPYWVNTESQDARTTYPSRSVAIPDAETHSVEIAFSGVPVTGVVVDKETDKPVAQAAVRAQAKDNGPPRSTAARTGPDGRFQLDAEPGEYTLSAQAEGYAAASLAATVAASGLSDARLELEKGLEITGRVLDAGGQGTGSVRVEAVGEQSFGGAETLPDGSFRIAGLSAKRYALCAGNELAGFAVRTGVPPGGAPLTLTLRPASRVRLRVKGPDGAPVAKAWANVTRLGGAGIHVPWTGLHGPTDATGIAEVPTPAGEVEIDVSANKLNGTAKVSVAEGATVNAEVTLTESSPKSN